MGVILAIAFDVASPDRGWASLGSSMSLFLAALTSLGLWLLGRRQVHFAAAAAGGRPTPGFAAGVAQRLAWRLRLFPAAPSPAAAILLLPQRLRPLSPDRGRRARPSPGPAALSSPLRAPPERDPDSTRPLHAPGAGI